MNRKLITAVSVLFALALLAGCGDSSPSSAQSAGESQSQSSAQSQFQSAEEAPRQESSTQESTSQENIQTPDDPGTSIFSGSIMLDGVVYSSKSTVQDLRDNGWELRESQSTDWEDPAEKSDYAIRLSKDGVTVTCEVPAIVPDGTPLAECGIAKLFVYLNDEEDFQWAVDNIVPGMTFAELAEAYPTAEVDEDWREITFHSSASGQPLSYLSFDYKRDEVTLENIAIFFNYNN